MKYDVILADPPWAYQNWTDKKNGAAAAHYKQLTDADICALPVDTIAAPDALLFLWATFPKLQEGLDVMRAWGFTYVTTPFVWNKTYADGRPYCGLGFWARSGAELVLLGRRGRGLRRQRGATGVRQVVTAPVMRPHSSKPPEVRDRIVELVGDVPRVELFAREQAPGWHAIGNEIDGRDIREVLC